MVRIGKLVWIGLVGLVLIICFGTRPLIHILTDLWWFETLGAGASLLDASDLAARGCGD